MTYVLVICEQNIVYTLFPSGMGGKNKVHSNGVTLPQDPTHSRNTFLSEVKSFVGENDPKLQRLRNMELFVLDNSLRETTVASIRAHTVENKRAIYEEVKKAGFKYWFIECFTTETRMGDLFVQELIDKGEDISCAFAFVEAWGPIEDMVPLPDVIPIGLQKMKKFGINNAFIEFDLMYHKIDYEKFNLDELCKLLKGKIDWVRENLSPDALIFANIRDFSSCMVHHPERVWQVINFISSLPPADRIMGIAYEDMGKSTTADLAAWTKAAKREMVRCGWGDGHLIFHVHEQWGQMHATNLECLASGATGIWAGVCSEGAALGHADSCTTILNMIRLGNTAVQKQYNCTYLRDAAIKVTEIACDEPPNPRMPIYGERALDMLFGFTFSAIDEDPHICEGFDMAEFLGVKRKIRISGLANDKMIQSKLIEIFGENPQFTLERCEAMRQKITLNAAEGRKEEYNSDVGLAMLFDLSGGHPWPSMLETIAASEGNSSHIDHLISEIKLDWDIWDGRDGKKDEQLTFDHFYMGFMGPYFGCYRCEDSRLGLKALDMDNDGLVDWFEFRFYLKWAGRQYPDVKTKEKLLDKAFRFGLIPAMMDECDNIRKEMKSERSHNKTFIDFLISTV